MAEPVPREGATTIPLELRLRYAHGLGDLAPYFRGLERGVAMATRCRSCGRSWFAPRLVCCCGDTHCDWVELAGRGTLVAVTRGRASLPGAETAAEYAFALVALDGADNRCFGRLAAAASQLRPGARVRLARAEGQWAHPAQCAEFVPDAGDGD